MCSSIVLFRIYSLLIEVLTKNSFDSWFMNPWKAWKEKVGKGPIKIWSMDGCLYAEYAMKFKWAWLV